MNRREALSIVPVLLLAKVPVFSVAAQDTMSDVPMLGGNPARTGEMPGPGPRDNPRVLWGVPLGAPIFSSPAVVAGVVYVGTGRGLDHIGQEDTEDLIYSVYALDGATGVVRWRFQTGDSIDASPAVVDGVVYVGSNDGNFYALDAELGQERWRFATGGPAWVSPAVVDGVVYTGAAPANLSTDEPYVIYALDAASGTERWHIAVPDYLSPAALSFADDTVYVLSGCLLRALNAADGTERWQVELFDGSSAAPVVFGNTVFVATGGGRVRGFLYAIVASSGVEYWKIPVFPSGTLLSQAVATGMVYVTGDTLGDDEEYAPGILAFDERMGMPRWSVSALPYAQQAAVAPAVVGDTVYWVDSDGNVMALDALTGDIRWALPVGNDPYLTACVVANGIVYVGNSDGVLLAIGGTA